MIKKCVVCGKEFIAKYKKRDTCSDACFSKRYYESKKVVIVKKCPYCGGDFTARKNKVYCSLQCKIKQFWLKNKPNKVFYCRRCGEVQLKSGWEKLCDACKIVVKKENIKNSYLRQKETEARKIYQRHKKKVRKNRELSLPHDYTIKEWEYAVSYFSGCAYCGSVHNNYEQEHFIPIVLGGGYTKKNIVPSCRKCNLDKSTMDPIKWLSRKENGNDILKRINIYFESL